MKLLKHLSILFIILFPTFLFAQKDSVLVKEASFRYEYQAFELEQVNEQYLKQASYIGDYDASHFETVTESVLIKPATVRCIVTEPVYKKVIITEKRDGKTISYEKEILVKRATIKKIEIPPSYGVITKTVFCCPDGGVRTSTGEVELKTTPAKYATYEKWVFKRKASVKRVEIPAEYKIID